VSAASSFRYCNGWISAPVDVVTMQPALVGCLQIQPIGAIRGGSDVQSEVGREHIPMLADPAATVDPLGGGFFLRSPHRHV
jgi:hypothetical protein